MTESNTAKRETAKKAKKSTNESSNYYNDLAKIKTKLKVGDIFLLGSYGYAYFYRITEYVPLDHPYPNCRRTMRVVAHKIDRPAQEVKIYSFSDIIQFAEVELHDISPVDGKERVETVPNYKYREAEGDV